MTEHEKPGFWAVLPAAVRYDPKLPSTAKLLYAEISALTDRTGFCFATNAYFQSVFGISERTLQDHFRALKSGGFIRIEDGDGGSKQRKIFAGINPLSVPPAENCGGPPQKTAGPPAENCGENNNIQQDNEQSPQKPPKGRGADYVPKQAPAWKPELFARFWDFYPLHKSKQAAIKAWDRLKPSDELLAVIGKALERQIAEKKRSGEEWKLHASTYLNNARWTDEPDPAVREIRAPLDEAGNQGGYIWV